MESSYFRRLILLSVLVVSFYWVASYFLKWKSEVPEDLEGSYSYEMIRPDEEAGQFDLSGREIDRRILNDQEPQRLQNAANGGKPSFAGKGPTKANTAAKAPNKKTKPVVGSTAGASPAKTMAVRVVGDDPTKSTLSKDSNKKDDRNDRNNVTQQPLSVAAGPVDQQDGPAPDADNNNKDEDKDLKLTVDEWRRLLQDHLDAKTASQITKAHERGILPDASFYGLVFEVFKSTRPQAKSWSLAVLGRDSSVRSFEFMAKEYSKLAEDQRADLWKIMLNYRQPSKFVALAQALHSKDKAVVSLALEVASVAVEDQKKRIASQQQQTTENPSDSGNHPPRNVAGQVSSQQYNILLSGLTAISQANDTSLSPAAQTLASDIQKFNKA